MVSSDAHLLTVRLDVLRDIIIEMAAALPPHCAGRLVNAIGGQGCVMHRGKLLM